MTVPLQLEEWSMWDHIIVNLSAMGFVCILTIWKQKKGKNIWEMPYILKNEYIF